MNPFKLAILWLAVAVVGAGPQMTLAAEGKLPAKVAHPAAKKKEHVILQVSDDNPKTWGQALNVIENLQAAYGKQNVQIELVAFGFGLGILKLESQFGPRVADALKSGAKINACQVTMRRQKLAKEDMLPDIGYVPAGVVEVIKRQRQGWVVIRP